MADQKISELNAITGANTADDDLFVIVDTSTNETKKIAKSELVSTINAALVDGAPTTLDTLNELAAALDDDANFATTVTNSLAGKVDTSGDTMTGDLTFGDNDKAIFGAGSDLQIYHDGSDSRISDVGTGNLVIQGSTDLVLKGTSGFYFVGTNGAEVDLYHNNAIKLSTTSTGIDVTGQLEADTAQFNTSLNVDGTATMDGLTVDGNATIGSGGSGAANVSIALNGSDSGTYGTVIQGKRNGTNQYILGDIAGIVGSGNGMASWVYSSNPYYVYTGNTKSLEVAGNGDISFYEDTGTTAKFFWDASAEKLVLANTAYFTNKTSGGGTVRMLGINSGNTAYVGPIDSGVTSTIFNASSTSNTASFYTGGSEAMRIDSSGNVGIGTSSPSNTLSVKGGAHQLDIETNDTGVTLESIDRSATTDPSDIGYYARNGNHKFFNGQYTERMRIDSSGNLLVGKTSLDFGATAGQEFRSDGRVFIGHSGAGHFVNRIGSDGSIAEFRKDGTTVGSIGTYASKLTMGTGGTGVRFNYAGVDTIAPWNVGVNAVTDGATSLGYSGARFKDLYLSGGVYLGGTGSANYLDDYESGTFTVSPTSYYGFAPTGVSASSGRYVKVGDLVYINFDIVFSGDSSSVAVNDRFRFNLPFAPINSENTKGGGVATMYNSYGGGVFSHMTTSHDAAGYAVIWVTHSSGGIWTNSVRGSLVYQVA